MSFQPKFNIRPTGNVAVKRTHKRCCRLCTVSFVFTGIDNDLNKI